MEPIGILIEYKDGQVKKACFGSAAVALRGNGEIFAITVDDPIGDSCNVLEAFGVNHILKIDAGCGNNPAVQAEAIAAAMNTHRIKQLIGLTSPKGRELLPRVAALLDAPLVMDCIEIDLKNNKAKTTQYSGKTMAAISLTGNHFIYGLRPNVIAPQQSPVTADIIEFEYKSKPASGFDVIETRVDGDSAQSLTEADIIISGGRGMKNAGNFKLLFECANLIGASVGASRVAVDNGWVPYSMQVGQTGAKVNPKLYVAVGLSGSVQHFAGMNTSNMIIAVNTDENAAIINNCDYYTVGDLFEIIPELTSQLKKLRGQ